MADERIPLFSALDVENIKENPREFFKVLSSFIVFYAKRKLTGPFVIMKDAVTKDASKVVLPPELKAEFTDVEINETIDAELRKVFENFVRVVTEKIPKKDLVNFYNNINTLRINDADTERADLKTMSTFDCVVNSTCVKSNEDAAGIYSPIGNVISVENNADGGTINHELFHLSSAIKANKDTKTFFSGFNQIFYTLKEGIVKIGNGLNEGYTEVLTRRYFPDGDHTTTSAYELVFTLAGKTEELIGQEKMQSLYLNADLSGLIESLKEYADEKDVMDFITNTDFLYDHSDDRKHKIVVSAISDKALDSSINFLIDCKRKKVIKEYKEGKYSSPEEAIIELTKFCSVFNGVDFSGFYAKINKMDSPLGVGVVCKDDARVSMRVLEKLAKLFQEDNLRELIRSTLKEFFPTDVEKIKEGQSK